MKHHSQEKQETTDGNVRLSSESGEAGNNDKSHSLRRLMVFQVKLAVDALRDILLSPISFIATVIDLIEGRKGKDSYFEMLMKAGRSSEKRINLFDQYQGKRKTVDSLLNQVEDILVKEYKRGDISAKTKESIEAKLNIKTKKTEQSTD